MPYCTLFIVKKSLVTDNKSLALTSAIMLHAVVHFTPTSISGEINERNPRFK